MERPDFIMASLAKRCIPISACILICLMGITRVNAATTPPVPITLSTVPNTTGQGVPPNILLTLDTSGSMARFYLPDSMGVDAGTLPQDQNSDFNYVYYNPEITYKQSVDANGNTLPAGPTFTAAWPDGYNHSACSGNTFDLSKNFPVSWGSIPGVRNSGGANAECNSVLTKTTPAFYYARNNVINGTSPSALCPAYPGSYSASCYTLQTLTSGTGNFTPFPAPSTRKDCTGTDPLTGGKVCTLADEQQNFANWFTYYRSRILMAKTTASLAFSTLANTVRVTHQTLYSSTIPSVKVFTGADRTAFFNWLQTLSANGGTPLRQALDRAGRFFMLDSSSSNDPYLTIPGDTTSGEYTCRQNYNVLITDGMWNQSLSSTSTTNPGDTENSSITLPDGTSYNPQLPYSDNNGITSPTTLADFAFKYWATDLRPKLTNNVPAYSPTSTSQFYDAAHDPATWQHLVNFMIPLGLSGNLKYTTNPPDTTNDVYDPFIASGPNTAFSGWPPITQVSTQNESATDKAAKVDDLWHAAINSRGRFYSAKSPAQLASALSNIFGTISSRNKTSSAGVAVSAAQYMAGNYVYQPVYWTGYWYGDLDQFDITDLTKQTGDAMVSLDAQNKAGNRVIISYNDATKTGIQFQWSTTNLSSTEQAALGGSTNGPAVLSYIRGDQSNELQNNGPFRTRSHILGDIVDSTPVFVGPPNFRYPDSIEPSSSGTSTYSSFVAAHKNRKPMIWVGANDGMLHCFTSTNKQIAIPNTTPTKYYQNTLQELVAYVPSSVYPNLPKLTDPGYTHQFYVDGTPTEGDVFYNGNWHSILVGGLNEGGRGIYALDVTNPSTFATESSAANDVLWEFTSADDPDLGYTYSQPQITKMNNGTWAVVFGNGYNSPNGDAVLYIVSAQTGKLIKKIDVGHIKDPTGKNRPDGLSTVTLSDTNGDFKTDYIYAGDLYGNLWKFDVSDTTASNWTVEKDSSGTPAPLFSTKGQPITTAPVVAYNAYQHGYMILFGTGSYLSPSDLTNTSVQSFYGIWDRNQESNDVITTIPLSDLLAQTITVDNYSQFSKVSARATSNNPMTWYLKTGVPTTGSATTGYLGWHLDLVEPDGTQNGERVTSNPQVIGNRIIFITNSPNSDPCNGGSLSSWLMELNASTGQPLTTSPFDYNGDGHFSVADGSDFGDLVKDSAGNQTLIGSGIQFKNGTQLNAAALTAAGSNEVKIGSKGNGTLVKIQEPPPNTGLRSWVELQ